MTDEGGALSTTMARVFSASVFPRLSMLLYPIVCIPSEVTLNGAYTVHAPLSILYSVFATPERLSVEDRVNAVLPVT